MSKKDPTFFHYEAKHIMARPRRKAVRDVVRYVDRTRERDLRARRSLDSVADYMQRSFDLEAAAAEVGAVVYIDGGSGLSVEELIDAMDKAARRRDGEYKKHGGKFPRLGQFVSASFSYGITLIQAKGMSERHLKALNREFGCAAYGVIHMKNGRPDHAHFYVTDRVVDIDGIGSKIRIFNGVDAKRTGQAIVEQGCWLAPATEFMRAHWADEHRRLGFHDVDHRSFVRQGINLKPARYVPQREIEYETRQGTHCWAERRRQEMAQRHVRRLGATTRFGRRRPITTSIATPQPRQGGQAADALSAAVQPPGTKTAGQGQTAGVKITSVYAPVTRLVGASPTAERPAIVQAFINAVRNAAQDNYAGVMDYSVGGVMNSNDAVTSADTHGPSASATLRGHRRPENKDDELYWRLEEDLRREAAIASQEEAVWRRQQNSLAGRHQVFFEGGGASETRTAADGRVVADHADFRRPRKNRPVLLEDDDRQFAAPPPERNPSEMLKLAILYWSILLSDQKTFVVDGERISARVGVEFETLNALAKGYISEAKASGRSLKDDRKEFRDRIGQYPLLKQITDAIDAARRKKRLQRKHDTDTGIG